MPVFFFDLVDFLLASGRRDAALGLPVRDTTGATFDASFFFVGVFGTGSMTFKDPCRLGSKEAGSTGLSAPFLDLADFGRAALGGLAAEGSFSGEDFLSDVFADVERAFEALDFREAGAGSAVEEAAIDLLFDFDDDFGADAVSVSFTMRVVLSSILLYVLTRRSRFDVFFVNGLLLGHGRAYFFRCTFRTI
jgi:hypothetical protein